MAKPILKPRQYDLECVLPDELWELVPLALRQHTPEVYKDMIDETLNGDTKAAEDLYWTLNGRDRGYLFWVLRQGYADPEVLRTVLAHVWDHDHGSLVALFMDEPDPHACVRQIFITAEYPRRQMLKDLPRSFPIYRGAFSTESGIAWTTDYEVAKWFVTRQRKAGYVLHATAYRRDVVFFHDGRSESEVITRKPPVIGRVENIAAGVACIRPSAFGDAVPQPQQPAEGAEA
jgi:hypothetical protein